MLRSVKYWALAGLLIPVVLLIIVRLQGGVYAWPWLAFALWPTQLIVGSLDAAYIPSVPMTTITFTALIYAISLNVAWYSLLGALGWWLSQYAKNRGKGVGVFVERE